jgi:hypothetical protein
MKALPLARYFQVTIFRARPGASYEFAEVMRIRNAAQDYINLDRPEIGYQIISGTESGTYVFLAPMQSLSAIDNAIATSWGRADGATHAARQASNKAAGDAEIWREQLLFRVEPKMSYVSETFGAASPEFWLANNSRSQAGAGTGVVCEHAPFPLSRRPAVRPDTLCRHGAPAGCHRRSANRDALPGFHYSPAVGRF